MRTTRYICVCIAALLASTAGVCQCVDQKREALVLSVVPDYARSKRPMHVIQVPGLTDRMISWETGDKGVPIGREVAVWRFYSVTPAQYQLKDNTIVGVGIDLSLYPAEWLVVVNEQNNTAYLLAGADDATAAFNRFIGDCGTLSVRDSSTALDVFSLFVRLTGMDRFPSGVVADEMSLEIVALEDFRVRYARSKVRSTFAHWWNAIPASTRNSIERPGAIQINGGYEVRYFYYTNRQLLLRTALVRNDGTISDGTSRVLVR